MIQILDKEDGDKFLLDFLLEISKINGSKRCAEESIKIMEDFNDSQLLLSILLINSFKNQNLIPPHITKLENEIASALSTIYTTCDKEDVPTPFKELFEGSDDEVIEKFKRSGKMFFAIQQFVSAYYHYDLFENKYPEINKML